MKISPHLEATSKQMRKACVEQSNVDEKYIDQTRNGYIPDNPELKCYILCKLEHIGAIDEKGTIDFSIVMHMLGDDLKESIVHGMQNCGTKCINFEIIFVISSCNLLPIFRWRHKMRHSIFNL